MSAEMMNGKDKMVFAILQGDDYVKTVSELTKNGFFVTMLNSTGGFLRKRSTTIMAGVKAEKLYEALAIIKRCSGKRKEWMYPDMPLHTADPLVAAPIPPIETEVGGATVFVLDLEDIQKF